MKKRFLILALTLTLVFCLLPLGAWADLPYVFEFDSWDGSGTSSLTVSSYGNELISVERDGKPLDEADYVAENDGEKLTVTLSEDYLKTLGPEAVGGFFDFTLEMKYAEPQVKSFGGELTVNEGKASMMMASAEADIGELYEVYIGEELIAPSLYEVNGSQIYFTDEFLYDDAGEQRYESGTAVTYTFKNEEYTLYSKIAFDLAEESDELPEQSPITGTPSPIVFVVTLGITAVLCALCVSRTKKNIL